MSIKNAIAFIIILLIFLFGLWVILPVEGERLGRTGLHLGLDLVGGVHLVYQADLPEDISGQEQARDMDRALGGLRPPSARATRCSRVHCGPS